MLWKVCDDRWVKAYIEFSGERLFITGLGEGDHYGLIPSTWTAKKSRECKHWSKWLSDPAKGDVPKSGVNYEFMFNFSPKQVKFVAGNGWPLIGSTAETVASTNADYILLSMYEIQETRQPEYTLKDM